MIKANLKLIARRSLLLTTMSMLIASCSLIGEMKDSIHDTIYGETGLNAPAGLTNIKASAATKILWSAKVSESGQYDFTPATDAGAAYAAGSKGEIAKFDIATGRQVWRINAGEKLSGGVGLGPNLVLVGTASGFVNAYDANGKALWRSKVSSEVLSVPKVITDIVIVRTGDNHIIGIKALDGSHKWTYERVSPSLSLRSNAGVAVDGGAVYAGFSGGKLVAIRADTGGLLWETTVAQPKGVTEIERIADITSDPIVDGSVVYAAAYQGKVAAIDRVTGRVMWDRDIASYSGLSAVYGRVFISHSMGSIYSLENSTGKTLWRQPALINRQVTAPLSMGALLAVGDYEGYIHILDIQDGSFTGRIKAGSSAVMPQMVEINISQFLAQTRDGGLYAISVK